ncbi:MAG: hypothetical protein AABX54_05680 [Nanoarchaeota archaeon]
MKKRNKIKKQTEPAQEDLDKNRLSEETKPIFTETGKGKTQSYAPPLLQHLIKKEIKKMLEEKDNFTKQEVKINYSDKTKKEIDGLSKKFLKSILKIEKNSKDIDKGKFNLSLKEINSFSKELFESIVNEPEETIYTLEHVLKEFFKDNIRIRFTNLENLKKIKIRDIRAEHINKLLYLEGYSVQVSDVRPQVVNAKFECPKCGTIIEVLQIERVFREPSRCSCGRKGDFNLLSKTMVDAQRIVLAEEKGGSEDNISPRISVFLKEDLTAPNMNILENIGKYVTILGVLREVPIPLPTGSISTRFDLAIEANNIIFKKK